MRAIGPPPDDAKTGPLCRRLVWFAGIAATAALAVAAAVYALRALLLAH